MEEDGKPRPTIYINDLRGKEETKKHTKKIDTGRIGGKRERKKNNKGISGRRRKREGKTKSYYGLVLIDRRKIRRCGRLRESATVSYKTRRVLEKGWNNIGDIRYIGEKKRVGRTWEAGARQTRWRRSALLFLVTCHRSPKSVRSRIRTPYLYILLCYTQ